MKRRQPLVALRSVGQSDETKAITHIFRITRIVNAQRWDGVGRMGIGLDWIRSGDDWVKQGDSLKLSSFAV